MPSEANREEWMATGKVIVAEKGPVKNEFHQDEKRFIINARRRKRKVRRCNVAGAKKVLHRKSRRHQTTARFTGAAGVGPDGEPIKIHFKWVSKPKTAKRRSIYHEKKNV